MKVLKFGGTSVGSVESIRNVARIIDAIEGRKIVVVSAMSGVTNSLVEITEDLKQAKTTSISSKIENLRIKHIATLEELLGQGEFFEAARQELLGIFGKLENSCAQQYSEVLEAEIVTYGESLLSFIFSKYLESKSIENKLLNSKNFMQVYNLENPDVELVGSLLEKELENSAANIFIAQGFVRIDQHQNISTLKRGGSDYTATIIGAAIRAEEVQIWTDIDGFHNNDPRIVEHTKPIARLSFEEAAELAYFGAKILHPQTISPVINLDIPVILKNTFTPHLPGTIIAAKAQDTGLKAISAKDGITAIKIKSNRMLMAHGFLRKIFEVFDRYETSIDMITTSEIAVSLTIDDDRNLPAILQEIEKYGEITVEKEHSIICIVGEQVIEDRETYRLFELLQNIPVRMISYGGSKNNISLLVHTANKAQSLRQLHQKLFQSTREAALV